MVRCQDVASPKEALRKCGPFSVRDEAQVYRRDWYKPTFRIQKHLKEGLLRFILARRQQIRGPVLYWLFSP